MAKKKFVISGMHCTSCALLIDGGLEDLEGVTFSSTSYVRQVTEVEFDEGKVTQEKILEIIRKNGYEAKPVE